MGFIGGHWVYLVILFMIVLIIWGPGKMPDVGAGLGRAIREFRKASSETQDTFHQATGAQQTTPTVTQAPVSPVPPAPAETQAQQSSETPQTPVTR